VLFVVLLVSVAVMVAVAVIVRLLGGLFDNGRFGGFGLRPSSL
jgi:hypothetical protein